MDHLEALRLQAAEKYILGELPADLREQFEEHYFDCPECASGLRALGTFVTASRLAFQGEEASLRILPISSETKRSDWFNWLRPVIALPAIGILAAIVIFQNTVTIPSVRKQAETGSVARVYESSYRLGGATRGGNVSRVTLRSGESFALDFDFTPNNSFPRYKGTLLDASGSAVLAFDLKREAANKEQHLVIPGGVVRPGNYELVFVGQSGTTDSGPKVEEVQRLVFFIELVNR
jgi:hypothetical protein